MQEQDLTNFEFVLKLGDNIIIQRFFNVSSYNPISKRSLDLYDVVSEICDIISHDLKIKNLEYMLENADLFIDNDTFEAENEEKNYSLQLKLGENVIIERIFSANCYHPRVRNFVDIRPMVKKMLYDLTKVLSSSSNNLEKTYLNYKL
jgi:hypothetical protein